MKNNFLKLQLDLRVTAKGERFAGVRQIDLLEKIDEFGSIAKAAKVIKLSYKAAWDAIDKMNELSDEPLVISLSGGKKGGATVLTPAGKNLIKNLKKIIELQQRFINQINDAFTDNPDNLLLNSIRVKTGVKNQFYGTIKKMKLDEVGGKALILVKDDFNIIANITQSSINSLELKLGKNVFALIKASSVIVLKEGYPVKPKYKNILQGKIISVIKSSDNTECVIEIDNLYSIVSIMNNEYADKLNLKIDAKTKIIFDPASVILGIN